MKSQQTTPLHSHKRSLLRVISVIVNLAYSGVALDGTDFSGVASVTIPAGSSSNTFTIPTIDDALAEGAESFTVEIDSITDANFEAVAEDPLANSVVTTITDQTGTDTPPGAEDTVVVSLTGPTDVVEGEVTTNYTLTLSQAIPAAGTSVIVNLAYSGVALDGTDFSGVASVTIPAGSSSNTFTIPTIDDALAEGAESFTVEIDSITDANFEAVAEDPLANSVVTTITDQTGTDTPPGAEDTVVVSLTATTDVVEGEVTTNYTLTLSQAIPAAGTSVIVNLAYSGVALDGTDFSGVASVTIPAGSSSNTFTIPTIDDALAEGAESFTVEIDSITDANFEAVAEDPLANSVVTTITDQTGTDTPPGAEDTVVVSLTATNRCGRG